MIEVKKLNCSMAQKEILKEIDFSISSGDMVAIVGPNGSGKTTLIKCLCAINDNWQGGIQLKDRNLRDWPRKERAQVLAYVPQVFDPVGSFSSWEFMQMSRYPYSHGYRQLTNTENDLGHSMLEKLGLLGVAKQDMGSLSGGERQKLYLAAALFQEPELLVLDEPTSQLDPQGSDLVHSILVDENKNRKTTILFVTHDLNRAALQARRILALKRGRLVLDGQVDDFINREFLREFYGKEFLIVPHPTCRKNIIIHDVVSESREKR